MPSQLSEKSNSDWLNPILDPQFFNRNHARIGYHKADSFPISPPQYALKMLQIQCGNCQRKLNAPLTAAGKSARCPCGEKILIPVPATSASLNRPPEGHVADATSIFTHGCECGRKLRVPQSDSIKKAKCPCGKTFAIPAIEKPSTNHHATKPLESKPVETPEPFPSFEPHSDAFLSNLPQSNSLDWANDLPPASPYIPPSATQNYAPKPSSSITSSDSIANDYLKNAKREKIEKEKRDREGGGGGASESGELFGSSALYGVAMMVGAVVWFVVGLFFDRIFFYPPVMFVFGLIALVRGLFDGD